MNKYARRRTRPKVASEAVGEVLDVRLFKALGDPSRIAILRRLVEHGKPMTVGEVAECCPTCVSVVSRHLAMLREAGILEARREGREVYYSIRFAELAATLRGMADAVEVCCKEDQ
jgi:ArsR family transcriptional regulator